MLYQMGDYRIISIISIIMVLTIIIFGITFYLTKIHTEKTAEGEVLDRLNLKKICCRRHMLTHVDIE